MKSKWVKMPLGEYAKINMGQSPKSEYYNENKEGTPFLQGNKTFGTVYPIFEKYTTKITKLAEKNEILFSVRAPVGEINIAPEQLCIGRGLASLNSSNNIFLYYLLKYNQNRYEGLSSGTVFSSINKNTLNKIIVNVPDSKTQDKISNVLWSLDSKIELNNQIISTLEEIASTLFKRWFVEFEFPNENGNPYKSSGGKMVDSELGEIPEYWSIGVIGSLIDNYDRKRIPLSKLEREMRKGKYPYYGAASVVDFVDDFLFDGTYLLLGEDGTVATSEGFPILQYVHGKFWVNNHAHVLKGKDDVSTEWLYLWFKQTNITGIITGAVQPKISQRNLNNLRVVIPDKKNLYIFQKSVELLYKKVKEAVNENESLIEIRDSLLPKLLSGKVEM